MTLVVMLVTVGLLAVYSASFALGSLQYGSPYYFVARQAMWAVVGSGLLVFMMRFDYHRLRAMSPLLMFGALVGLTAVLAPGIGVNHNGASRWIAMGPLPPVQPSEFAKLALIIYVSAWLSGKSRNLRSFAAGLVPFVVMVGLVAGLVMLEPDMGTTIIIVLTTITLFFVAGGALSHLFALTSIGGVTAGFLVLTGGYRMDRIFAFVSPEADPAGKGFHILQLLIALGSGGVTGLGIGASRQKFFYVPGAHTDGIFAIIGEEMGFIGAMAVILLFALLIYRGIRIMLNAQDNFGSLLALGITSWIAYQAVINIGGITRTMPLTGIPLPFLSYGGSALAATLAAVGILLNISRYSKARAPVKERRPVAKAARRRVREEGT
ncbi:MAG: putative lipid II flippase FtsW [Dehalococcoidia bacterium]